MRKLLGLWGPEDLRCWKLAFRGRSAHDCAYFCSFSSLRHVLLPPLTWPWYWRRPRPPCQALPHALTRSWYLSWQDKANQVSVAPEEHNVSLRPPSTFRRNESTSRRQFLFPKHHNRLVTRSESCEKLCRHSSVGWPYRAFPLTSPHSHQQSAQVTMFKDRWQMICP